MIKILTILGARPQFIKASVVSKALTLSGSFKEIVVHTGQHYDDNMSRLFFEELKLKKPKYNLGINGGRHGEMTGRMIIEIEKVLLKEKPSIVLVYGDTNSTLAGAMAAVKLHIEVAHVEAGLRSFNLRMPEEINRILTDRISQWLFAPTARASNELKAEGISKNKIFKVGDVMFDVALNYSCVPRADSKILKGLRIKPKSYVLATIHRAENTNNQDRLAIILKAFCQISRSIPLIWPIHPRTRKILDKNKTNSLVEPQLHLVDPVGYLEMMHLEKNAAVVTTDSGGVQKEAFFHGVPCVTLREETEWLELVESGWNFLAPPTDSMTIVDTVLSSITARGTSVSPYGKGDAAMRIARILQRQLT